MRRVEGVPPGCRAGGEESGKPGGSGRGRDPCSRPESSSPCPGPGLPCPAGELEGELEAKQRRLTALYEKSGRGQQVGQGAGSRVQLEGPWCAHPHTHMACSLP